MKSTFRMYCGLRSDGGRERLEELPAFRSKTPTFSTPGSAPPSGRIRRWAGRSRPTELKYYYPTSVLITSRDIITLWVARMVLMGLYNVGEMPFRQVYIHPKSSTATARRCRSRRATASIRST